MRFSNAVRQHWGVENKLHWVLDVSFAEDASRIRKDKGAQTFSVLRHIAVHLLRRESQHKRGIKARRKRAGGDRDYLLEAIRKPFRTVAARSRSILAVMKRRAIAGTEPVEPQR